MAAPAEVRGTPLAATAKIPGGAVTLLARLGHVGARAREDVTADTPDDDERETLRNAHGEPALRQRLRYEIEVEV